MCQNEPQPFKCVNLVSNLSYLCQNSLYRCDEWIKIAYVANGFIKITKNVCQNARATTDFRLKPIFLSLKFGIIFILAL